MHCSKLRASFDHLVGASEQEFSSTLMPSDVRRDLVYRASAMGSLYRSPLAIMAQAIRAILLASAMAATLVGFRANNAVSQGRCPVPWILA